MPNLRDLINRIAFAGLKPESPAKLPLGERLRRRFDRIADRLAGSPPPVDDPFYQSNRTWRQNLRVVAWLAVPCLLLVGSVVYLTVIRPRQRVAAVSAAAAVVIPSRLPQSVYDAVLKRSELEVVEVILDRNTNPPTVHGSVQNHSDQKTESAQISFHVTNKDGMLLGAVSTTVRNIAPHGSQEFSIPVPQKDAAIILVRDARRL